MSYQILYFPSVIKEDIPDLDKKIRDRVKKAIEKKLATHPEIFGRPLNNPFKNFYKLRVGDWRIVFKIEKGQVVIIFIIQHRSKVYKNLLARIFS